MYVGPFDKAVGSGKNPKLISVGPKFVSESRVSQYINVPSQLQYKYVIYILFSGSSA